jgi:hypothetical protein
MNDSNTELRRLREELRVADDEFFKAWASLTDNQWVFSFGPVRLQREIASTFLGQVYVIFNGACFVAGIVLCFLSGVPAEIGVALIVGALFSFGAFVSQFWAVVTQRRWEILDQVAPNPQRAKLRLLGERRAALLMRLDNFERSNADKSSGQQQV